jgi:ribonuclease E
MESQRNQREVENRLRDALRPDRARVQTGKISRFGLLELSRQRLQPSLGETSHIPCPRCHGTGHIRGTESSALHILRILQEEAMKENSAAIHAQVPVDVATFLLNEKRADIHAIESRFRVDVVLIPNPHLETPNYSVVRLRPDEVKGESAQPSYQMIEMPAEAVESRAAPQETKAPRQLAAVRGITPEQPAPTRVEAPAPQPSLFGKIKGWLQKLSGAKEEEPEKPKARAPQQQRRKEAGRPPRERRPERERTEIEGRTARGQKPRGASAPQLKETPKPERATVAATMEKPAAGQPQEAGEARGKRRRGRRERSERKEEGRVSHAPVTVGEGGAAQTVAETGTVAHLPAGAAEPAALPPVAVQGADTALPPVPRGRKEAAAAEQPAEKPAAEPRGGEIAKPVPRAPIVPAEEPLPSDLQLVETKAAKVTETQEETMREEARPQPTRRRRRPTPETAGEAASELILVETRSDLIQPTADVSSAEATPARPPRPRPPRPFSPQPVETGPLEQVETRHQG